MGFLLKKAGTALLLVSAFATAGSALAATAPDAQQGPTGSADNFALKVKVNGLAKFARDIDAKASAQKTLGNTSDSAEVKEMQARFKKEIDELAPKLVLTQSISEQDAAALTETFTAKLGANAPAYVAKINGKTAYLHECQQELMTPQSALTEALATKVADCAVTKLKNEAPTAEQATPVPAPEVVRPSKKEEPRQEERVTVAVPTPAPAPVVVEQPQQQAPAATGGVKSLMTPMNIGIAGGSLALLTIGGVFALSRKKKAPESSPTPTVAAPSKPEDKPKIEL